jgi:hypothetical protein
MFRLPWQFLNDAVLFSKHQMWKLQYHGPLSWIKQSSPLHKKKVYTAMIKFPELMVDKDISYAQDIKETTCLSVHVIFPTYV